MTKGSLWLRRSSSACMSGEKFVGGEGGREGCGGRDFDGAVAEVMSLAAEAREEGEGERSMYGRESVEGVMIGMVRGYWMSGMCLEPVPKCRCIKVIRFHHRHLQVMQEAWLCLAYMDSKVASYLIALSVARTLFQPQRSRLVTHQAPK